MHFVPIVSLQPILNDYAALIQLVQVLYVLLRSVVESYAWVQNRTLQNYISWDKQSMHGIWFNTSYVEKL